MLPPATPPFKSSTSQPGLFTSNDRITIRRGNDVKSRIGTGIFFVIYSHRTSILYFSCAEIGTTGAPSATVPVIVHLNQDMTSQRISTDHCPSYLCRHYIFYNPTQVQKQNSAWLLAERQQRSYGEKSFSIVNLNTILPFAFPHTFHNHAVSVF